VRKRVGEDVLLFTVDNGREDHVRQGGVPELASVAVGFGSGTNPDPPLAVAREHDGGKGPLANAEYCAEWFDHLDEPCQTRAGERIAFCLDEMPSKGGAVSLCMPSGGTIQEERRAGLGVQTGRSHLARLRRTVERDEQHDLGVPENP